MLAYRMLDTIMRFWFVHSGEVSLREQLITQITLGIAGGDLKPGERLPSTRAMAQRYGIHPNTISAAYRELEEQGRVESRRGSGVYVRAHVTSTQDRRPNVDRSVREFLRAMESMGIERNIVRESFDRITQGESTRTPVLIEPDAALARIVLAELEARGESEVTWHTPEEAASLHPSKVLVLPSKAERVRALLPEAELIVLTINSVPQSLLAHGAIPADALIGIASHWKDFLHIAQTMLLARGINADAILLRNANEPTWRNGLETCAAVICDVVTARTLPKAVRVIPFHLLSNSRHPEPHQQPSS